MPLAAQEQRVDRQIARGPIDRGLGFQVCLTGTVFLLKADGAATFRLVHSSQTLIWEIAEVGHWEMEEGTGSRVRQVPSVPWHGGC